ncbi:hypothetical protein [Aurantiacibacter odishensis]|uniref:hypothetical protein n=1 Tax=Aurantiacibacter odishensis TaxID=1155476 RepID=UPI000E74DAD1|nr:hypothetical protein [Aurantiacibacter odishensis]
MAADTQQAEPANSSRPAPRDVDPSDTRGGDIEAPVSFSVPLLYNASVYGDVVISISGEDVRIEAASLRQTLSGMLNEGGKSALDNVLGTRDFVDLESLTASGFALTFDENLLELALDTIDGRYRPVTSLFDERSFSMQNDLPVIEPAGFSAYLNVNANLDYQEEGSFQKPDLFVFGAARFNNVVVEIDGAFSGQFGPDYSFSRRSVRAVYDQPEKQRRFSAGDVRLSTIPLLRTPFIGGVAVEKRRQIFDSFRPVSRLSGREIYLDSRSTVNVLLNGAQYESFQLDAGRYDLTNLPLRTGANGVDLEIIDSAGRRQVVSFDYFFEPLELELGEEEYVFSLGLVAQEFNFEPEYTGDPVATGFYRRRVSEYLILGAAAEISEDIQTLGTQVTFVPQVVPGVFDLELATSLGASTGFAARGGYRLSSGNSFADRRQFSVTFDYEDRNYQTVGQIDSFNTGFFNLTTSYSHSLSRDTILTAGGTYATFSGPQTDRKLAFVDVAHRLTDRFRLTAGVEYGDDFFSSNSFGVRIGLTAQLGRSSRATADYRSRNETARLAYSRGGDRDVGSLGFDVGVLDAPGASNVTASMDYVGNRFEARASAFSNGTSLGGITDSYRGRLQIGTSLAYADGMFGVGRPISDSFAVVQPNPEIGSREVITGRDLSGGDYHARSGTLGAAVQSDLNSYYKQSVRYDFDIENDQTSLAVGDGLSTVEPPFRSGYRIIVGDNRFVSVAGTLIVGDEPASLWSGMVTSSDDAEFEPLRFFTNSFGRFAIIGLAPGKTYHVEVASQEISFDIVVPADNDGVLNLGEFVLPNQSE